MTPQERDRVRTWALLEEHADFHKQRREDCGGCLLASAVLEFVPPGDCPPPPARVAVFVTDCANPIQIDVQKTVGRGRIWHGMTALTIDEAKAIAWALLAAVATARKDAAPAAGKG